MLDFLNVRDVDVRVYHLYYMENSFCSNVSIIFITIYKDKDLCFGFIPKTKKKKKKLEIKHGIEDQTSTIRSSQSQVNAALQLLI